MANTAISAPGKVLLAGGYLVLEREYSGLVFGLSARIHVIVQDVGVTSSGVQLSEIVVRSPQFRDAQWSYGYHLAGQLAGVKVTQLYGASSTNVSSNPFVETALSYALTYISSVTGSSAIQPAHVTILADNDYYSQTGTPVSTGDGTSQFVDFGVRLQEAHKTGLGSSAALVTAFTGAVLSHYLPKETFDITTSQGQTRLHNLAQAAHCAAQGKIGSGFDVAAAVYGTCVYRRFSPSLLVSIAEPGVPEFQLMLKETVEASWDTEIEKEIAIIPKGTKLVMCDVDCGSQTVSMVKKVLTWRSNDPEGAEALWSKLHSENRQLTSNLANGSWDDIAASFQSIRSLIREMGTQAGVPIEPEEQTALLDALTNELDGVCGGVVPGAGGYDAVALLIKDDEATLKAVNEFLADWSIKKSSKVKLLNVTGEMEGARQESPGLYSPWI